MICLVFVNFLFSIKKILLEFRLLHFHLLDIGEFEIREYVRQICTGCSYLATNNIVHLDLKPENIVCTDILDGNINRLKVDIIIKTNNL